MKNICLCLVIFTSIAPSLEAINYINTNASGVTFRMIMKNRKNSTLRNNFIPGRSSQEVSFSAWQRNNKMNLFEVSAIVGLKEIPCGNSEGDSDNFQATFETGTCRLESLR